MTYPNQLPEPNWPTADPATTQDIIERPETLRLYGPRFQQAPTSLYNELRRQYGAVAPVLLEGELPAWFVIGYREVHQVLSNDQLFARDSRRWNQWDRVPQGWPLMSWVGYVPSVLFAEGEEHRRRSGAISEALAEVDEFTLRTDVEQIADRLIDGFASAGEADLIAQYAAKVPLLGVARMLGLDDATSESLWRHMQASVDGTDDGAESMAKIAATIQALVRHRKIAPANDVTSRLLAAPTRPSDEELGNDLMTVLVAGQRPSADWIGNTLRLMLTDPRFAVSLSGGRRSVRQALNEVLWADTPTQNYIGRWASRNTQLGGQQIKAGDLLVLGLAAANADPQVWPDAFEGGHGNHAQMSFSHGEHRCPYPAPELAEIICNTAVEVLLDRLPDVRLAVPPESLQWAPSVWMRGLIALPVEFMGYS